MLWQLYYTERFSDDTRSHSATNVNLFNYLQVHEILVKFIQTLHSHVEKQTEGEIMHAADFQFKFSPCTVYGFKNK
jgi:hypothetical protein